MMKRDRASGCIFQVDGWKSGRDTIRKNPAWFAIACHVLYHMVFHMFYINLIQFYERTGKMKNQFRKFVVGLLTLAMVVSTITPAAFAAPSTTTGADGNTDETSLSSTAETNIASANIVASLEDSGEETEDSEAKSAVKDAVFNNYNDTTDLSEHGISSEEMANRAATAREMTRHGMGSPTPTWPNR